MIHAILCPYRMPVCKTPYAHVTQLATIINQLLRRAAQAEQCGCDDFIAKRSHTTVDACDPSHFPTCSNYCSYVNRDTAPQQGKSTACELKIYNPHYRTSWNENMFAAQISYFIHLIVSASNRNSPTMIKMVELWISIKEMVTKNWLNWFSRIYLSIFEPFGFGFILIIIIIISVAFFSAIL